MRTICLLVSLVIPGIAAAQSAADPALLAADRALGQAVAQGDAAAAVALLDLDATWTDAEGRTLTGLEEIRARFARPAAADESGAQVRRFQYGRVATVQIDRGRMHRLRVWVQRAEGWRLLVQQDVRSLDAPPTVTVGTGKECDNPCKQVPYVPKTAAERGVIAAFQALETSSHAGDPKTWPIHVADEFVLVSSNSDRVMSKAERLAGLERGTFGGVQPTRLLSARMFEFGDVVVMRAQHLPARGNPLQVTRVWVNRNGVWQSVLSYQTSIAGPIAG